MSQLDLDALLAEEIERRLPLLADGRAEQRDLRAALHTLKGSAAMAGHSDLALVIAQCSARLRGGDTGARADAAEMLAEVVRRLSSGKPPFPTQWPEPPPGLAPSEVDPTYRAEYLAETRERLTELATTDDESARLRLVHAIKGSAAAVGDDLIAWYCHGLEAGLKAKSVEAADLPRHLSAVGLLLEDAPTALATLRARGSRRSSVGPAPSRRTTSPPEEDTGEHTVRVQGVSLERVLERIDLIRLAEDEVVASAAVAEREATRLRELRTALADALRLLGPPRPWGPPAKALATIDSVARSLGIASEALSHGGALGRQGGERLRRATADVRREVSLLRRTTLSAVLARVAGAVERLAEREGRNVRVLVTATDAPVEREVAERLVDPLMQLARNALAHGIELPEERVRRDKDPSGTLLLSGERAGDWLRIVCEDDGRGVDIETVRRLAVERGSISAEAARAAADDELLALLFVPGLTTKREADLLAGRGVGLDLALATVRRLGGTIRLERKPGSGLRATLELPSERWTTDVLWLRAGHWELALPVSFTGKLTPVEQDKPTVPLLACLGEPALEPPKLALELALRGIPTVSVGIDSVGEVEECNLRPLPTVLSQGGPFSGAILRGDGALLLALDATLLAVRAWALA